jgi:hypothetical protein
MMGLLDGIIKGYTDAVLGPDTNQTADVYKRLQDEMTSKYNSQKSAFEADPSNSGKSYQMPDALTRWQDQISGMIQSGDPLLQKEGLNQLSAFQQRATSPGTDGRTSSIKEYQFAQEQGYQGSYQQWVNEKAAAGRNSVNVSVNSGMNGVEGINFVSAADKERLNLPQGTSYYVNKSGEIKEAPGGHDIATQQQTNVTNTAVDELDNLMFGGSGIYPKTQKAIDNMGVPESLKRPGESAYAFMQQYKQDDPSYAQIDSISSNLASTVGRAYLGEKGVMTDEDVTRIKKLIPDPVRDSEGVAKQKMQYLKKILNTSDPTKVRNMVYGSKPRTSSATDKVIDSSINKKGPKEFTSSTGIKYTVE